MELSKLVKMRRQERGYSVRRLAEAAGISHTEIIRIEDGSRKQPSPGNLKLIAEALGIDFEEMMVSAGYIEASTQAYVPSRLSGSDDLTPEEALKVEEFIEFLKSKRR